MQNRRLIDAHMHLWDLEAHHHPWLVDHPLGKSYLLKDYLNESTRYRFEKAVHVQAGIDRSDSVLETAWIEKVSDEAAFPLAIVGYVDLSKPDCERVLEEHLAYPHFVGVRQILHDELDFLSILKWRKNIALLGKHELVFDAQIKPDQVDALCEVISNSQNVFVIEHLCLPQQSDTEYFEYWQKQMKKLAQFDHVFIKLSDIVNPERYFQATIELFGVERCMFGSNFPVDKQYKSLDQLYDGYTQLCESMSLTDIERDLLFSENAELVYFGN